MSSLPPVDAPPAPRPLRVAAPAAEEYGPRSLPLVGKRRSLLINPGFQVQAMLLPTLISVAAVTGLILALSLVMQASDAELPSDLGPLRGIWEAAGARWLWSGLLAAFAFGALLVTIGLVETHRAAGAVFKVQRHIRRVAAGDLDAQLRLRRSDHFQDVAEDFNHMVERLRDETRRDVEQINRALESLGQVRPSGRDEASARLAAAWDTLVTMKHRKERTAR